MQVVYIGALFHFKGQINDFLGHRVESSTKKLHLKRSMYSVIQREITISFSHDFYLDSKVVPGDKGFLQQAAPDEVNEQCRKMRNHCIIFI